MSEVDGDRSADKPAEAASAPPADSGAGKNERTMPVSRTDKPPPGAAGAEAMREPPTGAPGSGESPVGAEGNAAGVRARGAAPDARREDPTGAPNAVRSDGLADGAVRAGPVDGLSYRTGVADTKEFGEKDRAHEYHEERRMQDARYEHARMWVEAAARLVEINQADNPTATWHQPDAPVDEELGEHAGQGLGEHAGQGLGEHAGQGLGEHAGQGLGEHAGEGLGEHSGQGLGQDSQEGVGPRGDHDGEGDHIEQFEQPAESVGGSAGNAPGGSTDAAKPGEPGDPGVGPSPAAPPDAPKPPEVKVLVRDDAGSPDGPTDIPSGESLPEGAGPGWQTTVTTDDGSFVVSYHQVGEATTTRDAGAGAGEQPKTVVDVPTRSTAAHTGDYYGLAWF